MAKEAATTTSHEASWNLRISRSMTFHQARRHSSDDGDAAADAPHLAKD